MADPADLAVVVPTRDRWPILAETLRRLTAQTVRGFEVVVVVDGTDQTVPDLGDARVVTVPRGGPGAARNAGAAATDRPLVLFLGDDMLPRPDLVARHLAGHDGDPDRAVLGRAVWHPSVAAGRFHRWLDRPGIQFDLPPAATDDAGFARFYSCNVSLHRSLLDRAGGFDPAFAYYYEDLDLGWRLGEAGMRLAYDPEAVTEHLHDYDWASLVRRFTGIARGEFLLAERRPEFRPWYRDMVAGAAQQRPVRLPWGVLQERLPAGPLADRVGARAARRYLQRLAPAFRDAWAGEADLRELREYLGADFDEALLRGHVAAVEAEEDAAPDETTFYKTSTAYLYDLTVFAMSGTKLPYREALQRVVPAPARLLDYGCGIGTDGLRFRDAGYDVTFADFINPSTAYLRWRLDRRGSSAPVLDVEGPLPDDFDVVCCFDVLEHVDDPVGFLARLESLADVVVVNLLEPDPHDTHVHKPLPVDDLVARARDRGLLHHAVHHGRSHLLAYCGRMAPPPRWDTRLRAAFSHRTGRAVPRRLAARRQRRTVA